MAEQEDEGFEFHGMRLFRDDSNDAVLEHNYDFSEGEIEFLEEAKKHFTEARRMHSAAISCLTSLKVPHLAISIHENKQFITYNFGQNGELISVYDYGGDSDFGEPLTIYVPE